MPGIEPTSKRAPVRRRAPFRLAFGGLAGALLVLSQALTVSAAASVTLHTFRGTPGGGQPWSTLVAGPGNFLYGTTTGGGAFGEGTVYRVSLAGAVTVLHSFSSADTSVTSAGHTPTGRLLLASNGRLYGTTSSGGDWDNCVAGYGKCGTLFSLNTDGSGFRIEHRFAGGETDGAEAVAGVIEGSDGRLYGTTKAGGADERGTPYSNRGTVYAFNRATGVLTLLHTFSGDDGSAPMAELVEGANGRFYGTTNRHLTSGSSNGSVFEVTAAGGFRTLHRFVGVSKGANPVAPLIISKRDGRLYGTTPDGGLARFGVIFSLTRPATGAGTLTVVHEFNGDGTTGATPMAGLYEAPSGMMYGTTMSGGLPQGDFVSGVMFQLAPSGRVGVLKTFYDGADGRQPQTGVTMGSNGRLYGTALGGNGNLGVLYDYRLGATATLKRVSGYPDSTVAGETGYAAPKGIVLLDGRAPKGARVTLRSSNPAALSVPASVTVAKGWSDAPFAITTHDVSTAQVVEVSATYQRVTRRFSVTVYPAQ